MNGRRAEVDRWWNRGATQCLKFEQKRNKTTACTCGQWKLRGCVECVPRLIAGGKRKIICTTTESTSTFDTIL